ncbi:monothiol glutaredoxin-C8glutaredoxin-C8-like-like [Octopus vulgaris]|uniref:Monothiol glutaredoxin-C8glutaredoxin-C8-like-like n=1 Tax=Octopus vulgaris TaxID=6645 RepID=A0AA36BQZ0_OCTVU|nr:monothiol glutaredoxin-C8glutaredoxin-C8-like-like [Octopus vulgaris]
MAGAERFVEAKMNQRKVLLFCKSYVPACQRIIELLEPLNLDSQIYEIVFIDKRQDVVQIENYFQVLCLGDSREVPQLFICGKYFGGPEKIFYWNKLGKLAEKIFEAIQIFDEAVPTSAQELSTSESVTKPAPKTVLEEGTTDGLF